MFEKVDIHSLNFNPFDKIGKDRLLISATKSGKTNTMTASWGTLGHLWNKDVAIIFIRPQRYTKEFVDESETFTLSFFDDKHKELSYLGTKSGKDEDKISKVNFHIEMVDGNPTFEEAKEVFICKKLYVGKLEKEYFLLPKIYEKIIHSMICTMYILEKLQMSIQKIKLFISITNIYLVLPH